METMFKLKLGLVLFCSTFPVDDRNFPHITCQYYVRSEDSIELIQKAVLWISIVCLPILIRIKLSILVLTRCGSGSYYKFYTF
jgi:hypothetical protein